MEGDILQFALVQALEVPGLAQVFSPGSFDRDAHLERRLHERFAIPEYWIVDPDHGFVEVWRYEGTGYGIRARYDRSGTLECPEFPPLHVPLAPIFRDA